jgi:hypothetical protein
LTAELVNKFLIIIITAIGLSPGGSSPTLVQTKLKITQNNKITTKKKDKYTNRTQKI